MTRYRNQKQKAAGLAKSEDLSQMKYELERFFIGGVFKLYEDRRLLAELLGDGCAVEFSYGKLVLSCWGEGWTRSWRILACEALDAGLRLFCTKQMGHVTCLVELLRYQSDAETVDSRAAFASKIASLIEANLAAFQVEQVVKARDDFRHLSGIQTRLLIKERGKVIAGIAVGAHESQDHIDATLGAGLIWLQELQSRGQRVNRLALFVPTNRSLTIACRLTCIKVEGLKIALYEIDEAQKIIKSVEAFDQADLSDNLQRVSHRAAWPAEKIIAEETQSLLEEISLLSLAALDTLQRSGWIYLSIRGLTFARISLKKAAVEFGLNRPRKKLTDANRTELTELIARINNERCAASENRGDYLFRAQAERWLEAIIGKDVALLDPMLDRRFIYSQVPAYRGEQRSFIDLLAVTRQGRLVVIELKVSEDAEFVFQGLDYWMRIDWHRRRGDFERRGYFKGLQLTDEAPLLYLVAPLFRFHATTKILASKIAKRVPLYRIGINDDWRTDLRVLLCERLN